MNNEDSKKPSQLVLVPRDSTSESKRARERRFTALYEEALAIEAEDAKKAGQIGFVAKWMVHATLPYVQPKNNPPAWGRNSGKVSLLIQPGHYMKRVETIVRGKPKITQEAVSIGYPYGAYPRLILAWIATEVAKTGERELVLGNSLSEFMSNIGREHVSGGSRGNITLMRNQMQRLFSANIAVTSDPDAVAWQTDGFRIVDNANIEIWWNPHNPDQGSLWQSRLRLTERFHETLSKSPVPVDLRIVKALSRSAMAIDIYCWLTYRYAIMDKSTKIPWEALMLQFGSESSPHKFKENFLKNLKDVKEVYRDAKLDYDKSGILLLPSRPSVPKRIA
ncbi:replication protein RepA [Ralstonia insidiosa]|jgi:hypothetical protein|uniref:Pirin n=1 Tax=Ralstonia insidiosa TaxID=190721 RepID=A0A192A7S9_9RALS|nr:MULTISPECIES: replication protein RepA [Ralstonia]ANJ76357.1 hypothetical protein A9Y76_27540 [Ralstonia insidiosa]MBA9869787.1 hypothetical protein [Ralstonia insidiosa]MBA9884925.1 hypothetical protein [Ralstonia pickettii]MBA9894674.1 hypothetical protein [Ralstonia pickettii]MBA9913505.1 hypothetical protein [Ralstonia insidiosa]